MHYHGSHLLIFCLGFFLIVSELYSSTIFLYFLYQILVLSLHCLHKLRWEQSPPPLLSKRLCLRLYYFFLKCLKNSSAKSARPEVLFVEISLIRGSTTLVYVELFQLAISC